MPSTDYRTAPITFERGLIEAVEATMVPPGGATTLKNYVPEPAGNVRARVGWANASQSSAPATRKGRGIGVFSRNQPYEDMSFIQTAMSGTPGTGGSTTATWGSATTAGSLLVAVWTGSYSASVNLAPVMSSGGWTAGPEADLQDSGGSRRIKVWYKANAGSESGTVTVTYTDPGTGESTRLSLYEVGGIAASSPIDVSATATDGVGSDTATDTGQTALTSQDFNFVLAAFCSSTTIATGPDGYTERHNISTHAVYTKFTGAKGQERAQATLLSAVNDAGLIVVFKAKTSAAPVDVRYFVAQDDTTEFDIYAIDATNLAAGTWTAIESVAVSTTAEPVAFTRGLGSLFYTNPRFPLARQWTPGGGAVALSGAPTGRAIAFHKERLWMDGGDARPTELLWSAPGDPTSWDVVGDYLYVGRLDGEQIEDFVPFADALLIGKRTSLWVLAGSGPETFNLVRLPFGGAAPGRSIMPTPYGAVVAGREAVYLVSGESVDIVSQPIENSYGMTGTWMSTSFSYDTVYILDAGSGTIFALNMKTGTWRTETVSSGNDVPQILYNHDDLQLFTPKASTTFSLLGYRTFPSATRARDAGVSEVFEITTDEAWLVGPEEKFTPMHLFLKVRQRGGTGTDTGLTITPYYDGVAGTAQTVGPGSGAGVTRYRVDLGEKRGVSSVKFKFAQTVPSNQSSLMEVEEAELGFLVERVR